MFLSHFWQHNQKLLTVFPDHWLILPMLRTISMIIKETSYNEKSKLIKSLFEFLGFAPCSMRMVRKCLNICFFNKLEVCTLAIKWQQVVPQVFPTEEDESVINSHFWILFSLGNQGYVSFPFFPYSGSVDQLNACQCSQNVESKMVLRFHQGICTEFGTFARWVTFTITTRSLILPISISCDCYKVINILLITKH